MSEPLPVLPSRMHPDRLETPFVLWPRTPTEKPRLVLKTGSDAVVEEISCVDDAIARTLDHHRRAGTARELFDSIERWGWRRREGEFAGDLYWALFGWLKAKEDE